MDDKEIIKIGPLVFSFEACDPDIDRIEYRLIVVNSSDLPDIPKRSKWGLLIFNIRENKISLYKKEDDKVPKVEISFKITFDPPR